jgi:hypothetical protein
MASGDCTVNAQTLDLMLIVDASGAEQYINPAYITRAEFKTGEPPEKPSLTLLLISSGGTTQHSFFVQGERALVLRKELRRRAGFSDAPVADRLSFAPIPLPPRRISSLEQ